MLVCETFSEKFSCFLASLVYREYSVFGYMYVVDTAIWARTNAILQNCKLQHKCDIAVLQVYKVKGKA